MPAPAVLLFGPVIIILVKFKGEISPPKIHLSVAMLKSVFVDWLVDTQPSDQPQIPKI